MEPWSNGAAPSMPVSDRDLMRRLAQGDREALSPLMERHSTRVYRIALSYLRDPDEAQDALQDTFVKAFQNAARWDPNSEVAPWLMRIAVNHSIDQYRRRKRRGVHHTPLDDGSHHERHAALAVSPEQRAHGLELGERIARALETLPEGHRAVFVLRHYDGLSLEEIARALEISLGTVKSSLHRAIHRLRERLHEVAP
jgi:RNA polymerase sigma-70 factor (ECF subfamily)